MQKHSSCDLFISACEASGDAHAAPVLRYINKNAPHISVEGVAGPLMRKEKISCFLPMEKFQVMGFFDVLASLPKLRKLFYKLKHHILAKNPTALLCVDYPEFHILLEKSLKKAGYKGKIFHYIAPSVWAWRKGRAHSLAKGCDHLFTIFPFEKRYFSNSSLTVSYVGNPLLEEISYLSPLPKKEKKILALFPGSRNKELKDNFPLQAEVSKILAEKYNMEVYLCLPSHIKPSALPAHVNMVDSEKKYQLMKSAHLALATSGTVTLELALHQTPTVVHYAIAKRDYLLAKYLFRINLPFYCIVNILQQKRIFPELFGPHCTEENIYYYAERFLKNEHQHQDCKNKCRELISLLGEKKASEEVGKSLLTEIS